MSDPFRDAYAAAIDRADLLARENEDLRAELALLRGAPPREAPPVGEKAMPPPNSLGQLTLDRLERLSKDIDAHQPSPVPAPRPPDPPRADIELAPPLRRPGAADVAKDMDRADVVELRAALAQAELRIETLLREQDKKKNSVVTAAVIGAVLGFGLGVAAR
jgi:hypothetical protein